MKIEVPTMNGYLFDRYGKFVPADQKIEGKPSRSFPIFVSDVPKDAKALAVYFHDYDSVPVYGFTWIHWLAANLPVKDIPADISQHHQNIDFVQGYNSNSYNSNISKFLPKDSGLVLGYTGPMPPDKTHNYSLTVYALDHELELKDGYYLNEFLDKVKDHIIAKTTIEIPSRAK